MRCQRLKCLGWNVTITEEITFPREKEAGGRQGLVFQEPCGQRPRHATWQGTAQAPKIHTVIFGPPCPVPPMPPLETRFLPPMAWYLLLCVSPSAITQDKLTLALAVGPDRQNSWTSFQGQKELGSALVVLPAQMRALGQSPHFCLLISLLGRSSRESLV